MTYGIRGRKPVALRAQRLQTQNTPVQSEQLTTICSDWVGSFFACSPCVSRVTGLGAWYAVCQWPDTNDSKSERKTAIAEFEPLLMSPMSVLYLAIHWLSLLPALDMVAKVAR